MPTGIILKSASHEVSDEVREKNLQAVVESAGYEVAPKEVEIAAEPKRDEFKSEEEFETAHVAWQDKEEEREEKEAKAKKPEPKDDDEVTPPRKSRRERAIQKATAELNRKLADANAEIEKLKSGGKKEPEKEEAPKEAARPKRADFANSDEGLEEYENALLAWGVAKAQKDSVAKTAEQAEQARLRQNMVNYIAQIEEGKEAHDDWDEVFAELEKDDITIGVPAQNMLFELENGAEVSYYLARHPTVARKLGTMSPLSAVAEVVRLSEKLKTGKPAPSESDEEKHEKPKPKVPAPVRTVNTGGESAVLTFKDIAMRPDYPGKAKDLRKAQAER